MNGQPTIKQKKFHEWCRDHGCMVNHGYPEIHHIGGAKMKLKGVKNTGDWYCIPLSFWWHRDGCNPAAVHISRSNFKDVLHLTEKEFWLCLMETYKSQFGCYPMPNNEYEIIADRA